MTRLQHCDIGTMGSSHENNLMYKIACYTGGRKLLVFDFCNKFVLLYGCRRGAHGKNVEFLHDFLVPGAVT